jgi:hypothetical protein
VKLKELTLAAEFALHSFNAKYPKFSVKDIVVLTKLGIGIEETNAGIGFLASMISVLYRNKKMPDCISLVRPVPASLVFFIPILD